jgi:ATP-dependent Lon protease
MDVYETLPIVPLRDVVVFPHMMMPFVIGRASSIRALEHALAQDKRVFLAAQHDASVDDPKPDAIRTMGCVANVAQSLKLPDGHIKVLVEGIDRARAIEWKEDKGFYLVRGEGPAQSNRYQRRRRRNDEPRGGAVRTVREALTQPAR